MKTYLNIFFLFLILCASCGSRKANDNKETTLQAGAAAVPSAQNFAVSWQK